MMGKKRGNHEGTITKRSDGRWEARITLDNGKRKCFYGKTRQDVARKLNEAIRKKEQGLPALNERQTVAQFSAVWLETMAHTVGPTTLQRYEQIMRLHILPSLGSLTLAKLTPQHVQALYAKLLNSGLGSGTVHHIHVVLHHLLKNALRLGLVYRNVTEMIDSPRVEQREMMVLTPEQARQFLAVVKGHRLEALYILALSTGMRQGELLGLRWRNVDLERGALHIQATLKKVKFRAVIAETKTKRSRRRITLTPAVCEALRQHRARQLEERLKLGSAWEDLDLVFPNTIGRPFDLPAFNRTYFHPLIKQAGLPPIRFHDLRHTAATLLLLQGVNVKVVSEMLGHASVSITLDLYSHVLPDMQREAAIAMQNVLGLG